MGAKAMLLILARIVVSVVLFCAPFVAFIAASGAPEMGIILIFPMIGAIPAILAAVLLFVPAEWLCDRIGARWLKNIVVPMLGATLIYFVAAYLMANDFSVGAQSPDLFGKLRENFGATAFWMALGAAWGVVWRLTDWIARRLGLVRARPLFRPA